MSTFFGADVGELRQLAGTFENAAAQLSRTRTSIGGNVQSSPWTGPVAFRFRSSWDSQSSTQLAAAADRLSNAAASLRRNAAEQEGASAASGSGQSLIGASPSDNETNRLSALRKEFGHVLEGFDNSGKVIDLTTLIKNLGFLKALPDIEAVSKVLGPLGWIAGGYQVANDINNHDLIGALLHGGSTLLSGAATTVAEVAGVGVVATGAAAIGLGGGALVGLIDIAIPYSTEKQDATYAQGFHSQFGESANPNSPTSEQAQIMQQRYSGPLGVATMISDQMDATAAPIREASRNFANFAGDVSVNVSVNVENAWNYVFGR
jgi:hypothetical protein